MRRTAAVAALLALAGGGCHTAAADFAADYPAHLAPRPVAVHTARPVLAPGTLVPLSAAPLVARAAPPDLPPPSLSVVRADARDPAPNKNVVLVGGVPVPVPPDLAAAPKAAPQSPVIVTAEPRVLPTQLPPPTALPPQPLPAPKAVPATPPIPVPLPGTSDAPIIPAPMPTAGPGPIRVGDGTVTFDHLERLIDGGARRGGGCSTCGGSCGPAGCAAGKQPCEPFPTGGVAGRFVQLVYESICCPDPCYQPRWEPITAAAFFADAPRPVTQTRLRWDYGSRLTYPDRGEFFWARADGNGKGPKPNAPARGVPAVDYHELYLDQEIATAGGLGSVTITTPYRSVNPGAFAESAAGFGDLQITAKSLLFDRELFLFAFQMRTIVPTGQARKGLGVGHTVMEPGVIAGLRLSPDTYAVAQVAEWIPLGGDADHMGAALRYNLALNHVWWRPVRDVQFIGTWELTGMAFQDGLFTDPVLGPQKLSGQTTLNMGFGGRLFFCDTFDLGAGWNHALTGKALVEDQLRVEFRYRY